MHSWPSTLTMLQPSSAGFSNASLCPAWGTSWEALRPDASTRPQMPSGVLSVSASNARDTASSDSSPAARKQYSTNGQSDPLMPPQRNSMLLQYARSSAWNRTSAARSLKSISSPLFPYAGVRFYFALRKLRSKKICPKIFVFDFKYQCHFFRLI